MSRIKTAVHNDLQLLALVRDEVKVKAHLLKADVKQSWDGLEEEWARLSARMERAGIAAGAAGRELDAATAEMVGSLKKGYTRIRDALRS